MGAGQSGGFEVSGSSMGYQVLRVYPNSPGSRAGLKAYFDFIVAIGNTRFNKENGALREILKASVDQKLKMVVFNTRTKSVREVDIVPSTNWGGNGLLGVSIKHSSFDRADERVWHVVEVENGSPAQQAGFKANEDYVIGSDSILQENDDLYNLIETHEGKALKLFVYNVAQDNCREVICHPNSKWGGRGYLGCEFGHGLLHRIPFASSDDEISNNPRASLLRNQQPIATQEPATPVAKQMQDLKLNYGPYSGKSEQTSSTASAPTNVNTFSFQSQLMNKPIQRTTQPGHHMFQQVLLGSSTIQPQHPQQNNNHQQQPTQPTPSQPSQAPQQFHQPHGQSQSPPTHQSPSPQQYQKPQLQPPPQQPASSPPQFLQPEPQSRPTPQVQSQLANQQSPQLPQHYAQSQVQPQLQPPPPPPPQQQPSHQSQLYPQQQPQPQAQQIPGLYQPTQVQPPPVQAPPVQPPPVQPPQVQPPLVQPPPVQPPPVQPPPQVIPQQPPSLPHQYQQVQPQSPLQSAAQQIPQPSQMLQSISEILMAQGPPVQPPPPLAQYPSPPNFGQQNQSQPPPPPPPPSQYHFQL